MIFQTYKTVTIQIANKKINEIHEIFNIIKYLQAKNLDAHIEIKPESTNLSLILVYPVVRFSKLSDDSVSITIIKKNSCGVKSIKLSEISLIKVNNIDEEVLGLRPDVTRWSLIQPLIEESKLND